MLYSCTDVATPQQWRQRLTIYPRKRGWLLYVQLNPVLTDVDAWISIFAMQVYLASWQCIYH